jgi:transposase InsO family protein
MRFNSNEMDGLWEQSVWKNQANWVRQVHTYNPKISEADARAYFNKRRQKDIKMPTPANLKEKYKPIFSKQGGAYQFDIWDQKPLKKRVKIRGKWKTVKEYRPYFLIVINVNTKKAYQYYMPTKSADDVLKALQSFWSKVHDCKVMVSDQDSAFLDQSVVNAFVEHGVKLSTTTDNDHHSLGIINRLMRTLRDLRGGDAFFTQSDMERQVRFYNNNIHSATGEAPNEMTKTKERKFIKHKTEEADAAKGYDFEIGSFVRFLKPREKIGKVRSNYTVESYKIIQKNGRSFVIQAKDGSTDTVPGWQLAQVFHKDLERYPQGDTLKHNKRGFIETVEGYVEGPKKKKKKGSTQEPERTYNYVVRFEGEKRSKTVSEAKMREGAPTDLSLEEKRYWVQKCPNFPEGVPERILKMVPKIRQNKSGKPPPLLKFD